jgi:hypothetical protein
MANSDCHIFDHALSAKTTQLPKWPLSATIVGNIWAEWLGWQVAGQVGEFPGN